MWGEVKYFGPRESAERSFVLPLVFVTNKSESHFVGKEYEMTIGIKTKNSLGSKWENGDIALVMHVQSISSSDVQLSVQEKRRGYKGCGF